MILKVRWLVCWYWALFLSMRWLGLNSCIKDSLMLCGLGSLVLPLLKKSGLEAQPKWTEILLDLGSLMVRAPADEIPFLGRCCPAQWRHESDLKFFATFWVSDRTLSILGHFSSLSRTHILLLFPFKNLQQLPPELYSSRHSLICSWYAQVGSSFPTLAKLRSDHHSPKFLHKNDARQKWKRTQRHPASKRYWHGWACCYPACSRFWH